MRTLITLSLLFSFSAFAGEAKVTLPKLVAQLHRAIAATDCQQENLTFPTEVYDLSADKKLYLVPCSQGANNIFFRGYISHNSGKSASQLLVLDYDYETKNIYATADLNNADFDVKTGTLNLRNTSAAGACGRSSLSKVFIDSYNAVQVQTTEIRVSADDCSRTPQKPWEVVFKQTPVIIKK